MHYSLQANHKTKKGIAHPDRNAQFAYINERTKAFQVRGQLVISIDTKKAAYSTRVAARLILFYEATRPPPTPLHAA